MGFIYRMNREGDHERLIRLWDKQGGWDAGDPALWRHRFVDTPLGESYIAVIEDDTSGDLVAQLICVRSLVTVDGQEVPAVRPFAPIVSKEMRGRFLSANPLKHPAVRLFRTAMEALRERGVGLSYMLPDPTWMMLYKMMPRAIAQIGTFPLWSRPLPLERPLDLGDGYSSSPLAEIDERVDALFSETSRRYGCMVVRDRRFLPWKLSHGGMTMLGIERGGELVGFSASDQKGDDQRLICDLLCADDGPALRATLAATVNLAQAEAQAAPSGKPLTKAAILATPPMQPVLEGLGFVRDDYDFPLVVRAIDPSLAKDAVAPARWYLSGND